MVDNKFGISKEEQNLTFEFYNSEKKLCHNLSNMKT